MEQDFSELIKYLDEKFGKIDDRFEKVNERFDKVDKQFSGLPEIFATRKEIATKLDFEELRKDFARLETAVDAYAKKADTYFQEMVMLAHKVDRMEKWIQKMAEKIGMKLEY